MIEPMTPERVALIKEKCTAVENLLGDQQVHTAGAVCFSLAARYIAWLMTDEKITLPADFLETTMVHFLNTVQANIELKEQGGKIS